MEAAGIEPASRPSIPAPSTIMFLCSVFGTKEKASPELSPDKSAPISRIISGANTMPV